MCPVCISTAAVMIAGAGSTGGVGALIAKKFLTRKRKGKPEGGRYPKDRLTP